MQMTGGWDERWVQDRAYAIWEQAGRPEGEALGHWLQAEAEFTAQRQTPKRRSNAKPKASPGQGKSRRTEGANATG
jgi:DUF2934 family protein